MSNVRADYEPTRTVRSQIEQSIRRVSECARASDVPPPDGFGLASTEKMGVIIFGALPTKDQRIDSVWTLCSNIEMEKINANSGARGTLGDLQVAVDFRPGGSP